MNTYKIKLELVVKLSDETKKFYDDSEPDLHESLCNSKNAKLTIDPCELPVDEDWN